MFAHLRTLPLLLMVLASSSLGGCHKEKAAKVTRMRADPAEMKRLADDARQSLKGLATPLSTLRARYAELQQQFDPLPPGLPSFGETRATFYSAAIGVGTLSAKAPWLAGRIEAAVQAGDRAALVEVAKDIAHTQEEIQHAERVARELSQRVGPFQKLALERADEFRLTGKATCE